MANILVIRLSAIGDVAKLVFGGVILAGIMKLDVNRALLFTIGGILLVSRLLPVMTVHGAVMFLHNRT